MNNHNSLTCNEPFCSDCWAIIKGNITGIMNVADKLRNAPKPKKGKK